MPDYADRLAAGRPFPLWPAGQVADRDTVADFLRECRNWWLAAADTYMAQADAGQTDALDDVRRALAEQEKYAPKGTNR